MILVEFKLEYAKDILEKNLREIEAPLLEIENWEEWFKQAGEVGPAWTLIREDGEVIGCGGVALGEWSSGTAWLLLSSLFYSYVKTTFKLVKEKLEEVIKEHELQRVQALVDPKEEGAKRFLSHLGFQEEGMLRAYGPTKGDFLVYGRIC